MNAVHPPRPTDRRLRVLAVHRYYWPDTPPYATLLRRIVRRWRDDGHAVEVLAGQPSYKAVVANEKRPRLDEVDGIAVRRLDLPTEAGRPLVRMANAVRMSLAVAWRVATGKYDVVMISTVPQVLGAFAMALAARLTRTRFIYHCMDLHPEIGRLSGEFANAFVYRALMTLDRFSCCVADPVVVLSDDMHDALRSRPGGQGFRVEVLNNFSLPVEDGQATLPFAISDGAFTLLFAGNIGRFQGLEALVEAMGRLAHRGDIELLVLGEGARRTALEDIAWVNGARVRFVGQHPVAVAKEAMKRCSAAFIGLAPGVYRYAYPSKTMTYLEQGCPLLVAVEEDSSLARDVALNGLGMIVPGNDPAALSHAIETMASDPGTLAGMSRNALAFRDREFSEAGTLDRWSGLLRSGGVAR